MKKLISVLLAALMLACILPLGAFAIEEESVTFYYTEGTYIQSADGKITLNANTVGDSGWAVDAGNSLNVGVGGSFTTRTIITHVEAVVSAGGENYGDISVHPGVKQQSGAVADGETVYVTDINNLACNFMFGFMTENDNSVEFSQIKVYYHTHNYQPIYICCDCGAEASEGYDGGGEASTLSEGNLAIVTAVAGVALGLVGGLLIGKKKKSAAE